VSLITGVLNMWKTTGTMLILSTLLLACSFVYFKPIFEGRIASYTYEGIVDGQYYDYYDVVWRSPPFKWYNGVAIAGAIAYLLAAAAWLRGWGRGASAVSVDEMP